MALNTSKCNHLTPLRVKGLKKTIGDEMKRLMTLNHYQQQQLVLLQSAVDVLCDHLRPIG